MMDQLESGVQKVSNLGCAPPRLLYGLPRRFIRGNDAETGTQMYFKGIAEPDSEPSRNRHAEAKRKSKFTEAVAKTVVDGDLYFSMRCPAHERFYVPVEKGEHESAEDGLLCVTHVFRKPFEDIKGRWEAYDGGGNLVIKLGKHRDVSNPAYAARETIEQALYRTPLGRVVGRDTLYAMSKSLCTAFGLGEEWGDDDTRPTYTLNDDAEALAKNALRDLLSYAPESGYDERLGEIGAEYDGVGFAENAVEYALMINGASNGFGNADNLTGEPLPLMSQPVFYAALGGKGEGRGFQSRIDALMQAVGLTEEDLRHG